ncbi:hypothetical protein BS50DRAFT_509659, partial [Corynespora cassiicola Philippines]
FILSILCVYKVNKKLKIYVNYYKLNALIKKNIYLIFRINKLLVKPSKAKFFTKLNIYAVFNKI